MGDVYGRKTDGRSVDEDGMLGSLDDELVYLNKARIEEVHQQPVQTVATHEVSFTINGVIADVDGTIPDAQPKQVESIPPEKRSPRLVRRFFRASFGDVDVIPFCQKQWCKLKKLFDECEECFPLSARVAERK